MFDGGIRTGQDVLRALALGARSCLIGRAYIFGLGAGGEAGVARAIDIIRKELDVSMALTGVKSVKEIGRHILLQQSSRGSSPLVNGRCIRRQVRGGSGVRIPLRARTGLRRKACSARI
jgi:FMN-dependent dehydrogenase